MRIQTLTRAPRAQAATQPPPHSLYTTRAPSPSPPCPTPLLPPP
eukprot:CAMPEP_0180213734 /NCGR_PEP_ID=MMETSP0987-20121128/14408_1 /TAXON_ID=697907 /ORGANISM="non described non described, Strain CCMP2293" /LENGTH=43 /DNA_ID= /DNA_START= /DNA_END= /DNA_ORIENTATION=